jgi:K+-transporting ATPase ATPase B chain
VVPYWSARPQGLEDCPTDIVKGGMRERFDHLRAMGIRTMMITGDNRSLRHYRAAGRRDDFLAEAKPEDKMSPPREQAKGSCCHDRRRTNDVPRWRRPMSASP